jgi:hypothetical protein
MTVDMTARRTSVSRVIAAEPSVIFAVISDASLHPVIDGSGTVKGSSGKPEPLHLGSRFGMKMKIVLPYRITSEVVEFEQDRLIAWQHFGKHRWRYELEPVEGGTRVTETFDWSTSRSPQGIERMGYPAKHEANMELTLERLDAYVRNKSNTL